MHPVFYQFALGLWGILPGNYSGIAPVSDQVYAIVDDKRDVDGFELLTLDFNPRTGRLRHAELTEPEGMTVHSLANYEGMCWGPTLDNGRRTLLLIADSQKGYGNKIYHLRDYLGVLVFRDEI